MADIDKGDTVAFVVDGREHIGKVLIAEKTQCFVKVSTRVPAQWIERIQLRLIRKEENKYTAKFKVGQRVTSGSRIGTILEVRILGYDRGIEYQVQFPQKKEWVKQEKLR